MKQIISLILVCCSLIFSGNLFAQQSGGGVPDGLEGVCQLAGGTWHGSEASGSWACCWADWGCYGCINNVCKMKCETRRCRRANSMPHVSTTEKMVDGLAPSGMKSPVIPKNAKPGKVPANVKKN